MVDDQDLVRAGFLPLLRGASGLNVVGEAGNANGRYGWFTRPRPAWTSCMYACRSSTASRRPGASWAERPEQTGQLLICPWIRVGEQVVRTIAMVARVHLSLCAVIDLGGDNTGILQHAQLAHLYQTLNDRFGQAAALNNIAAAHVKLGHHEQAAHHVDQAVAEQDAGEVGEGLGVVGFAVVAADESAVVEQPG